MSTPNGTGNVERSTGRTHPYQPGMFQIRIRGYLDDAWADWFSGMAIVLEEDGHTLLTGLIEDQAALFGLLRRIRDLGMPLVSIHPVDPGTPEGPSTSSGIQKGVKGGSSDHYPSTSPVSGAAVRTRQTSPPSKGADRMNTSGNPSRKMDKRVLLSTLWIVVLINMLKADVLSLYIPGAVEELQRFAGTTPIPVMMLGAAVLGELAIVMIILSRALTYRLNRWVNILVGAFTIVYVWAGKSAFPHYTFIAAVETICLLVIVWNAWKWTGREA